MAAEELKSTSKPEAVAAVDFAVLPLPHEEMAPVVAPAPPPPEIHQWRVSLPWAGVAVVSATDRDGAIAAFNKACGVIDTVHKHSVELMSE